MLITTGALLLLLGGWLVVRAPAGAGRHRAGPQAVHQRGGQPPDRICEHGAVRPGQRPHRLEAQDAALSRR